MWQDGWVSNAKMHKLERYDREAQLYAFVAAAGTSAERILTRHYGLDLGHVDTRWRCAWTG